MTETKQPIGARGGRDVRLAQSIITIFALYARAEGNWLSVASVIGLMADLGGDSQAVRSAISRLKRREVLLSEQRGGAAGYSLAETTLEALAEGDVRIFERSRASLDDGWVLVVFSVPESQREKRHSLRSCLTRLGFGTAAPGVWVAPGNLADETCHALERRGLSDYVDIFRGQHFAFGDLRAKVRDWWDLEELIDMYTDFLQNYRPVLYRSLAEKITPREAFQIYLPILNQWRQLPYRDPGLPLSILPAAWNGEAALELFSELNAILSPLAQKHALTIIHGRQTPPSSAPG